jgi:hypothetical protein
VISVYFKPEEIRRLREYCTESEAFANGRTLRGLEEKLFWSGLGVKLDMIAKHPMCCWCDSSGWDLDNVDETVPDERTFPCPHQS